jgi:hypothetical protein
MRYSDEIVAIANQVGFSPEVVFHVSLVYETIDRFSGLSIADIERLIVIGKDGEQEIPHKLKAKVVGIIRQHGDVAKFFSPMARKKYLASFMRKFLEERQQPKDYLFEGVLGFREARASPRRVETVFEPGDDGTLYETNTTRKDWK